MIHKYLEHIKPELNKLFQNDSSGHDMEHLNRTYQLVLKLCEEEKGDEIIAGIAAYMHDIHRIMQNSVGNYVSPSESIPVVKKILSNTDLTQEQIEEICFCIENHENYNWNSNSVSNINALILQDADNLDAIGAIGIARAFTYGGANGIPMYTGGESNEDFHDRYEECKNDHSTIGHFYHKLFRLADNMNTKTAKLMAKSRIAYMRDYVEELKRECFYEK